MKQITERINYLQKAINTLRSVKFKDHNKEINRIISICEYEDELKALQTIVKSNRSLFN